MYDYNDIYEKRKYYSINNFVGKSHTYHDDQRTILAVQQTEKKQDIF